MVANPTRGTSSKKAGIGAGVSDRLNSFVQGESEGTSLESPLAKAREWQEYYNRVNVWTFQLFFRAQK